MPQIRLSPSVHGDGDHGFVRQETVPRDRQTGRAVPLWEITGVIGSSRNVLVASKGPEGGSTKRRWVGSRNNRC